MCSYIPDELIKHDCELLKMSRKYRNFTQKDMAEAAGISESSYRRFEKGKQSIRTANFTTTCKILSKLQINISEFYNLHKRF